jgi:quinol monooxygenase YgiN
MKKDRMTKDSMSRDGMAPSTWALASSAVDLSKHLGHTVTVTGSPAQGKMDAMGKGVPAFTVTSLKMVAASCP